MEDSPAGLDLSRNHEHTVHTGVRDILNDGPKTYHEGPKTYHEVDNLQNSEDEKEYNSTNGREREEASMLKIKCDYGEKQDGMLKAEPLEIEEPPRILYNCRPEYGNYDNEELDRHSEPCDLVKSNTAKLKCDICGLGCVSLNVLVVHKRSHTVEKPFKCEFCGRSYKQRSSLEEHKERCRTYQQNASLSEAESSERRHIKTEMGSERALILDRLASNVAKRKRSMPQKFIGEKHPNLEVNYSRGFLYEKEREAMLQGYMAEQPFNSAIGYLGAEPMRSVVQTSAAPTSEMVPVISSLYPLTFTHTEIPSNNPLKMEKIDIQPREKIPTEQDFSPNNSGQQSTDSDNNQEENQNFSFLRHQLTFKGQPRTHDMFRQSSSCTCEILKVLNKEGEIIGSFRCDHCRILFLDYVMFTIHMGCHGFRDPFECNMCGHRSHDKYEFSSHIIRGEHRMGLM
ncbi:zinc finger protein Aiolos isoform X4 [Erythrolamprus reginae]|uniref:zinc finger protein Aiolos isoform X4 n=1 Tax=Erythrolamprus reginae TaxID=121349 RepID=UPI00396C57AC